MPHDADYDANIWEPMVRDRYARGGWCELDGRRLTVDEAVGWVGDKSRGLRLFSGQPRPVFRGARTIAYLKAYKPSLYIG